MSKSLSLKALNELIGAKKSALNTWKNTRAAYRSKTGQTLSKNLFEAGLNQKLGPGLKSKMVAKYTTHHVDEGSKVLRKLKKLRKNIATDRDTELKLKFNFRKDDQSSFIRKLEATDSKNKFLGSIHFDPDHADKVVIMDTYVNSKMRNKGIGTALFDKLAYYTQRIKSRFLVTSGSGEIRSPSMVSIRDRYRTKYIGRYMGKYNEDTKVISSQTAKKLIAQDDGKYRGSVNAVTDVSKKHVRFIRRNGRVIPIRIKK